MAKVFGLAPHPLAKFFAQCPKAFSKVTGEKHVWSGTASKTLSEIFTNRAALAKAAKKVPESASVTVMFTGRTKPAAEDLLAKQFAGKGSKGDKVISKLNEKESKDFSSIELAFADLMVVDLKWLKKGESATVGSKKGFTLTQGFKVAADKKTASLTTKNGDVVVLSMAFAATPATSLATAAKMLAVTKKSAPGFKGVTVPDTYLNKKVDYTKAVTGLMISSANISLLKQSTELTMNSVGVKVVVKTEGRMRTKGISAKPVYLVFDKPFTMAIFRKGIEAPIFVAYCDLSTRKSK